MMCGNEESAEVKSTTPGILDQLAPALGEGRPLPMRMSKYIILFCPKLLSGSET